MPAGRHNLVLYDGVQEVARAAAAVELHSSTAPSVRAYGWLTNLSPEEAPALKARLRRIAMPPERSRLSPSASQARPVANGHEHAGRRSSGAVEAPAARRNHGALRLAGVRPLHSQRRIPYTGTAHQRDTAAGLTFQIEEVAPPSPPTRVTARVQFTGPLPAMTAGER